MTLAWKLFLAFSGVLGVVLVFGLWSLQATRHLHALNQSLLTRAIPAAGLEVTLAERVPTLARHETRAVVLRDPAYQTLHDQAAQAFRRDLAQLAALLEGPAAQEAVQSVRVSLMTYLDQVDREWRDVREGRPAAARARSDGTTRKALDALATAIEALRRQSGQTRTEQVAVAGRLEHRAAIATLWSLGASLAVGAGLSALVAVRVTRPIRALSEATRRITRGDYAVSLTTTSRDEVGELARAFRAMVEQLQAVETLKADLLANLSHDLRSPLNSIEAAATLLQTGALSPRAARWLEIIHLDSRKILRLTNEILDLGKLRAEGLLRLDLAAVELSRIVDAATQELQPEAHEKGVHLCVVGADPPRTLRCDTDRIQQVLVNLLSNALTFTPKGGQITLTVQDAGPEVVLAVEDTGCGIPAAELPRLFDRYHQAHRRMGGTGLGLAIVKAFVEAHGGRVWVESQENVGSRFQVTLPREGPPA
jgi:signal transduction histidine kinase